MSLHLTEAEYAAYLHKGQAPPVTEKAWQGTIQRLLDQHGYAYRYHTWDSRRSPSGFPDLIAVHHLAGRPLLAVELKTDTGQLTLAQQAWLDALAGCTGVVAECWRPSMLEEICRKLRE